MAPHIRLDNRDKAALRALDDDFAISADSVTATVSGQMELEVSRLAHYSGDLFQLRLKLPDGEPLDAKIRRVPLLVKAKPVTALERAKAAIAANPEKSNRAIAAEIGVGEPTVSRARKAARDGKAYPSKRADPDDDDSPQSQWNGYLVRADVARSLASYPEGPIDDVVLQLTRDVADTWVALVEELKAKQPERKWRKRKQQQPKRRQRK